MGIPINLEEFAPQHTKTIIILEKFLRPRRNQDSSTSSGATLGDAKCIIILEEFAPPPSVPTIIFEDFVWQLYTYLRGRNTVPPNLAGYHAAVGTNSSGLQLVDTKKSEQAAVCTNASGISCGERSNHTLRIDLSRACAFYVSCALRLCV